MTRPSSVQSQLRDVARIGLELVALHAPDDVGENGIGCEGDEPGDRAIFEDQPMQSNPRNQWFLERALAALLVTLQGLLGLP